MRDRLYNGANCMKSTMDFTTPGFGWTFKKNVFNDIDKSVVIFPLDKNHYIDEYDEFPSKTPYQLIMDYLNIYLNIPDMFDQSQYEIYINQSIRNVLSLHCSNINEPGQFDELINNKHSNKRRLKWNIMIIKPNIAFKLHAHPNLELIYVIKGTMHEFRLTSEIPKKEFDLNDNTGPNLSNIHTKFIHRSINEQPLDQFDKIPNAMFVNEIGSIHLSFTKDDGATLLVLWSGNHANIPINEVPVDGSLPLLPETVKNY